MSEQPVQQSYRRPSILLPGVILVLIALTGTVALAAVDSLRSEAYHSLWSLLAPDAAGASWTMALVGTSEGVAIAIVIVVVVLGIQLTADRYSPRIIDIFVRDPLNGLVLALFLGSIIFTIVVSSEIKVDYVPRFSVGAATGLAVLDFAVLLPYVRYLFEIMRAETIIRSVRSRAERDIRAAARGSEDRRPRHDLRDTLEQIKDIALGSIQEGDTQVCLSAIEALRGLVVEEYLPLKKQMHSSWFAVDFTDMPGASEETIQHVDKTGNWLEHSVLADFVDLIGETPAFRKEVVHAIARASRSIGEAAVAQRDHDLVTTVTRFFNTYLRASMNQRSPTFAYPIMNQYRTFALHVRNARPDVVLDVAERLVGYGRSFDAAGMPFIVGTAAEDVAEMTTTVAPVDEAQARELAGLLSRTLTDVARVGTPMAVNGVLKAVLKLLLWSIATERESLAEPLLGGVVALPADKVDSSLDRMERTTEEVFWEVSDRVVAFDWVEEDLRALIPDLRSKLASKRAVPQRALHPEVPASS